jgi:hypothetical protein
MVPDYTAEPAPIAWISSPTAGRNGGADLGIGNGFLCSAGKWTIWPEETISQKQQKTEALKADLIPVPAVIPTAKAKRQNVGTLLFVDVG